jgi:hypothetical protein
LKYGLTPSSLLVYILYILCLISTLPH